MEMNNKQCADSALCTSTEEWINAAAKAMADRSTITFIEAVLKASPMEVHALLAAEYRKAMMHALSHQWRDAREDLPEECVGVLVDCGDYFTVAYLSDGEWYQANSIEAFLPIRWMPIPQPPKPEES